MIVSPSAPGRGTGSKVGNTGSSFFEGSLGIADTRQSPKGTAGALQLEPLYNKALLERACLRTGAPSTIFFSPCLGVWNFWNSLEHLGVWNSLREGRAQWSPKVVPFLTETDTLGPFQMGTRAPVCCLSQSIRSSLAGGLATSCHVPSTSTRSDVALIRAKMSSRTCSGKAGQVAKTIAKSEYRSKRRVALSVARGGREQAVTVASWRSSGLFACDVTALQSASLDVF